MKGKDRCKILKDIRKRIADENDIEFIVSECKHKGDCLGTCPKCESELRYLERELEKRRAVGKKVTVAGLALSVSIAASSCTIDLFDQTTDGVMVSPDSSEETFEFVELDGEIEAPDIETLMGDVPPNDTVDIPGEIYVEEGLIEPDDMDETLMGAPIPDVLDETIGCELETDAPVSETVETVAETPIVDGENR